MSKRPAPACSSSGGQHPAKLPRGGYRQRLRCAEAHEASDASETSALASCLIEKWSWGEISAPLIQRLAAAAVHDGAKKDDLDVLASLGSKGQHPGNCHAELLSRLAATHVHRAIRWIHTHMKKPPNQIWVGKILSLIHI